MEYRRIKSTGYCPEQDCEYTVEVEFSVFNQIGAPPIIRKHGVKCPYRDQHGCQTPGEACPVRKSAHYPQP